MLMIYDEKGRGYTSDEFNAFVQYINDPYGMREYKALLEKALKSYNDPMSCPFGMDPFNEGAQWRLAKQEAYLYALEMLPEIPDVK